MVLATEIIKIIAIIAGGILIIIIGNKIQNKKKQEKTNNSEDELPYKEQEAKRYIEQYKHVYSKESIKQGLIQTGNTPENAQNWIEKYM